MKPMGFLKTIARRYGPSREIGFKKLAGGAGAVNGSLAVQRWPTGEHRTASDDTNYTTGANGMNASLRIKAKHAATVAINNWLLSLFLGVTGSAS